MAAKISLKTKFMKKIFFLLLLLATSPIYSQYISPGNGSIYTIEDLVAISDGAVTLGADQYYFNEDITISLSDTLYLAVDGTYIEIGEGLLLTIEGVMIVEVENVFSITNKFGQGNFLGIRFDNSSASVLKNTGIANAGGVKLVESDMLIENCSFSQFDQSYSTPALDLYHSNPIIRGCIFKWNDGPAIASGANGASSPHISNNLIEHNVESNSNTPQINLGTSDGFSPIVVDSNTINGMYEMAGGIAVSTLAGGNANAMIRYNEINDNRYGIAMIGSNISGQISHNIIVGNNIQNDPMQGGSGINFYGGATNQCIVSHNTIVDNLWGITIQLNASPNIGDGTDNSPGHNIFIDNQNSFQIYALYNNTPGDISALNNFWGTVDLAEAEDFIFHKNDDLSLGEVFFDPMWINPVGVEEDVSMEILNVPNPVSNFIQIKTAAEVMVEIYQLDGQKCWSGWVNTNQVIDVSQWVKACYILKVVSHNSIHTKKIIVQ